MTSQLKLFDTDNGSRLFQPHTREDNAESQGILDANRDCFTKDCRKVYNILMAGKIKTVKQMDVDRARISDLKRNGVQMSFKLTKNKYKRWYMTPEQIRANRELENDLIKIAQQLKNLGNIDAKHPDEQN